MLNAGGIGFLITAKDMASAVIQRVERALGTLGPAAKTAGKALATAFVGGHAFAGGIAAMKGALDFTDDAAKFEVTMSQLRVISGATGGQFERLRSEAIKLGLEGMHGPQDAALAMRQLAQSGYTAEQALKTVAPVLRMLTASGGEITETADAARVLSMVFKAWGVEADAAVDKVAKLANMTDASFGEMQTLVSHVLRGTGIKPSMEETFALVGFARNLAGNMESASTMVGVIMERFADVKKMKPFEALGVEIFDKAKNAFRGPLDILKQVYDNPKWKTLPLTEQLGMLQKGFGSRQQQAIQAVFTQIANGQLTADKGFLKGADLINYYIGNLTNAAGASEQFEKAMMGTHEGRMKALEARWKTLKIQIGEGLLTAFRPLLIFVDRVLTSLGKVLEAIPADIKNIAAQVFVWSLGIATVIGGFVTMIALGTGLFWILKIVGFTLMLALVKPLLIAAGAFAVLAIMGAAFYAAWKNNMGGIATGVGDLFSKIHLGFKALSQLFKEGGTWGDVDTELMKNENSGVLGWVKAIWLWINRIKAFASGMWQGFVDGLEKSGTITLLLDAFQKLLVLFGLGQDSAGDNASKFDKMASVGMALGRVLSWVASVGMAAFAGGLEVARMAVEIFQGAWYLLGPIIMNVFDLILSVFDVFASLFEGNWRKFFGGLANIVLDLVKLIVNLLGGAFKLLLTPLDWLAKISGKNYDIVGGFDAQLRAGVDAIDQAKFKYNTPTEGPMPARSALAAQTAGGSVVVPAPVVNVEPPPMIVRLDGDVIYKNMAKRQKDNDARSGRATTASATDY